MKNKLESLAFKKAQANVKFAMSDSSENRLDVQNKSNNNKTIIAPSVKRDVDVLKDILKDSPSSKTFSSQDISKPDQNESGAVESVNFKKYVSNGRMLASTKVVDIRSYVKPGLNLEQDKFVPKSEDKFDDNEGENVFSDLNNSEIKNVKSKLPTDEDDIEDFFNKRKFLQESKPKPKVKKTINKKKVSKKKKIDIDIISGGANGDVI